MFLFFDHFMTGGLDRLLVMDNNVPRRVLFLVDRWVLLDGA